MKTTFILTAALVLTCTASAFSQDKALRQTINLDADAITVAQLTKLIQKQVKNPLSLVIEEPAQDVILPGLRFRDATIQTVFDKVVTIAPIRVATIPSSGSGSPVIVISPMQKKMAKHPEVAPVPLHSQNKDLLQTIDLNAYAITVSQLAEFIQKRSKKPLNFVISAPAQKVALPRMYFRNVTIQTLLNTVITVVPLRVSTIPSKGGEPQQIFIESVQ